MSCKVISVTNQKGGVGKTITSFNLAVGLHREGNKVLLIDVDPQGSLCKCLGYNKMAIQHTLTYTLMQVISDMPVNPSAGILHHQEGIDFVPSNIKLNTVEAMMVASTDSDIKHYTLKKYVDMLRENYDYIVLDTSPNLNPLTLNALACADSVLIPCEPASLAVDSFKELISTVVETRKSVNPNLGVCGMIITKMQSRLVDDRDAKEFIHNNYGSYIKVFDFEIPLAAPVNSSVLRGQSLFSSAPNHKVTLAYKKLVEGVIANGQ